MRQIYRLNSVRYKTPKWAYFKAIKDQNVLNVERRKFAQILGTVIVDDRGPIYMGKCNLCKR